MKHIKLDSENESVKHFVLSLPNEEEGSVLELGGRQIARVLPIQDVDREKLKAAILARRDESRRLGAEWEHADREVWEAEESEPR